MNSSYGQRTHRWKANKSCQEFLLRPLQRWSLCTLFLAPLPLAAQRSKAPLPSPAHAAAVPQDELTSRLATAAAARSAGNPEVVESANTLVVASALREMAALRAAEGADAQASTLYTEALALEPNNETRLALATVAIRAGHYPEATRLTEEVRRSDPGNVQADRVLSTALMQQGKYVEALAPLERVAQVDSQVETQYALANCLLATKRPADKARAQQIFTQIAAQHGDSGSLHVLMGRAYRDSGDMPDALREFQRALEVDPHTPHAHYFLGLAKLSLNEWRSTPEAEEQIREEAKLYPSDYLANYMTGFLLSGDRQYAEATPFLEAAARLDPTVPDPHLYLGLNAYAQSNNAAAEPELRRAVELTGADESRANFQIRRAYVDLGRILTIEGKKDEAEVFLAKARALQNKTMEQTQQEVAGMVGAGSGAAAVVSPGKTKSAEVDAASAEDSARLEASHLDATAKLTATQRAALDQREKQLRSVLALAYNDLGTSEAMQGRFPAAVSLYSKAEDWDATLPGLEKNLGQSEFRAGHFEAAVSPLTQALLAEPQSHGLRAMLGLTYFDLDRYAEAAHAFAPLGQPGMLDDQVGYAWAASLARVGDNAQAAQVLTTYVSQPRPVEVELLVGQLWTAIGDYPRAIATLQRVVSSGAATPQAHLAMGLAYIHWEHWPEAAKEFEAQLAEAPGNPDGEYHLGFVYLQQGKSDQAVRLFQDVVAAHPGYANAQYQLGKLQLDRGEIAPAIAHLQAAERSSPSTDYIHYQLQAAYRKASRPEEAEKELAIYKQLKADARQQAADRITVH